MNDYDNECKTVEKLKNNGYVSQSFYDNYCEIHDDSVNISLNDTKFSYSYVVNNSNSDCG